MLDGVEAAHLQGVHHRDLKPENILYDPPTDRLVVADVKDLFAPNPVPLKFEDEDWQLAWVAVSDEKIVGVIITNQEWVSDLWVLREHRL